MDLATLFCLALASVQSQDVSSDAPESRALIPREVLFGNPDRAGVKISPDGLHLSYVAPLDGVMNVWVRPINGGEARAVTSSAFVASMVFSDAAAPSAFCLRASSCASFL